MDDLKHMIRDIRDEIEGARHYAKMAYKHKGNAEERKYSDMAKQELEHADNLRRMAHIDPEHEKLWHWMQEDFDEQIVEIKAILG